MLRPAHALVKTSLPWEVIVPRSARLKRLRHTSPHKHGVLKTSVVFLSKNAALPRMLLHTAHRELWMQDRIFRPGDRCGGYTIERILGSGGFAEVYQAARVGTGETVALKCLQRRHSKNAYAKERMIAEGELLAVIRHQNLVHVYEVGIDRGILFMAMEFLSGRTLREVLKKVGGRLPIAKALYVGREIADGVDAAHELNVVHRDLKPDNVMITDDGRVKVVDMGAAKFFGWGLQSTATGNVIGTPLYMAPEHVQGREIDARSDVYAVGTMLYEMIAGHFLAKQREEGISRWEAALLQINYVPPPLVSVVPGCPADVSELVHRAMAKRPEDRFASMSELAQALRRVRKRLHEEMGAVALATSGDMSAGAMEKHAAEEAQGRRFVLAPDEVATARYAGGTPDDDKSTPKVAVADRSAEIEAARTLEMRSKKPVWTAGTEPFPKLALPAGSGRASAAAREPSDPEGELPTERLDIGRFAGANGSGPPRSSRAEPRQDGDAVPERRESSSLGMSPLPPPVMIDAPPRRRDASSLREGRRKEARRTTPRMLFLALGCMLGGVAMWSFMSLSRSNAAGGTDLRSEPSIAAPEPVVTAAADRELSGAKSLASSVVSERAAEASASAPKVVSGPRGGAPSAVKAAGAVPVSAPAVPVDSARRKAAGAGAPATKAKPAPRPLIIIE